jgi:stress response protein YsnF
MAAFKEGTIELTETAEVPVVAKQARVVEEVVIDKDVEQRTETVRDTVRRTDVQVEELDADDTVDATTTTPSGATKPGNTTSNY